MLTNRDVNTFVHKIGEKNKLFVHTEHFWDLLFQLMKHGINTSCVFIFVQYLKTAKKLTLSCIQSVMFGTNPTNHWVPLVLFSSMVVAASGYGYACHRQGLGSFLGIKSNGIELITGKILEENLLQSAFQQSLGDKFIFHQDNNLKHWSCLPRRVA